MTTTIISPHLDDSVLSCWHLLSGDEEVVVLNVFTASPGSQAQQAWWDRLTGAHDYDERMAERRAEDAEALAIAGARSENLGFLDEQYRTSDPSVAEVRAAIAERLPGRARVYAPAGLMLQQGDHALARSAALELRQLGHEVLLYADLPHAVSFGWPEAVSGASTGLDVEALWEWELAQGSLDYSSLERTVHELDGNSRRRKFEAVRTYRTQLPALERMFGGLDDPAQLTYEVSWELPR